MSYQGKETKAEDSKDEGTEVRRVTKDEAAFILGRDGKTKAKLCAVSGAQIELAESRGDQTGASQVQIKGTAKQRRYAQKYLDFVIKQRIGPVQINNPSEHDDLTILVVPADTVSFITGKQGCFLRLVEDEWKTLLFFLQVNPKNPPAHVDPKKTERLAIFGPMRRRRGAELKVMAAIEAKMPGHFTKNVSNNESRDEGFGTDTMVIKDEDYGYALGKAGSTRKKLARASGCIVEYVNHVAYFCGSKKERVCAKEYLQWLLRQRVGDNVHVEYQERDDVTMIMVASTIIGFVTGHKGASLRAIEEETSTFCFIEGTVDDVEEQKPLLIFGCAEDRRFAEALVLEKISQKFDDGGEYNGYGGGKRSKGKGKGDKDGKGKKGRNDQTSTNGRENGNAWSAQHTISPDATMDAITISDDDAAFLMGASGKTKKKIAAVSGAYLEFKTNRLEIVGTDEERAKAKRYIQLVQAQRIGPVRLDDVDKHDDVSIVEVPAIAVSFVTGKQGSFLRLVEEDFGTLLFFLDFNRSSRRDQPERLAIFGSLRKRRGAELKVMAAIEMKQPGYYTKADLKQPMADPAEGFATDRLQIEEDDYSYALGKGGATRRKIARASCCVIEYIGRVAYMSGVKQERVRAREYLTWLFRQRVGAVEVNYANRNDVLVLQVPKDCVGFVTGHKGTSLRAVEDATGTFCFIEGGRDDPHRDPKPLLVFGCPEARKVAEEMLRQRIEQKVTEGWVQDETGYGGGWGAQGKNGNYKGWSQKTQRGNDAGNWTQASAANGETPAAGSGAAAQSTHVEEGDDDEEGASQWGNWGGSSDDEAGPSGGPAADTGAATPTSADSRAALQLLGVAGKWSESRPTAGSGQRSGNAAAAFSPARIPEELELPPQLIHEEAWPDLGAPKKKR